MKKLSTKIQESLNESVNEDVKIPKQLKVINPLYLSKTKGWSAKPSKNDSGSAVEPGVLKFSHKYNSHKSGGEVGLNYIESNGDTPEFFMSDIESLVKQGHMVIDESLNESGDYIKFAKGKTSGLDNKEKSVFNGAFPIIQKYAESKKLTAYIIAVTEGHRKMVIEHDNKRSFLTIGLENKTAVYTYSYKDEDNVKDLVADLKPLMKKYGYKLTAQER